MNMKSMIVLAGAALGVYWLMKEFLPSGYRYDGVGVSREQYDMLKAQDAAFSGDVTAYMNGPFATPMIARNPTLSM